MNRDIERRRCPECAKQIEWATRKKGSHRKVRCLDRAGCGWQGPFYDSIPLMRRKVHKAVKDQILKAMNQELEFQLSGTTAISEFEDYTLGHPNADPDARGNQIMEHYIERVSQLQFLQKLLAISEIESSEHKDRIMQNEIDRMFPKITVKVR